MRSLAFALMTSLLCAQLPQNPARIQVFEATPKAVKAGEPVELRWSATGADWIRLEPPGKEFPPTGHVTYVPRERTVFWIHASNLRGGQSVPLVVEMIPEAAPSLPAQAGTGEEPRTPASGPPPGGIWIQFAALANTGNAESFGKEMSRLTGTKVMRFDIDDPDHPGQTLHRLRMGPFPSAREARMRLRSLQPKLRSFHIKPFVAID